MSESKHQEWTARFQRFQQNPSSVDAFCRLERISSASFYLWKRRLAAKPTNELADLLPDAWARRRHAATVAATVVA